MRLQHTTPKRAWVVLDTQPRRLFHPDRRAHRTGITRPASAVGGCPSCGSRFTVAALIIDPLVHDDIMSQLVDQRRCPMCDATRPLAEFVLVSSVDAGVLVQTGGAS